MKKKLMLATIGLLIAVIVYLVVQQSDKQAIVEQNFNAATKRKKYLLNKLWRDKAAIQMEEIGEIIHRKVLTDEEYSHQLSLKLLEEATEVIIAAQELAKNIDTPQEKFKNELTGEIGDVLEVLDCIVALYDLSYDEIERIRTAKREDRGSYLQREFVTLVEAIPDGYLHQYYLRSPERHPELID